MKHTNDVFFAVLMAGILRGYKEELNRRKIFCLNKYFDRSEKIAWQKARGMLEAHVESLSSLHQEDKEGGTSSGSDKLHPLTPRVGSFISSLVCLSSHMDDPQDVLRVHTTLLQKEYHHIIKKWAQKGDKGGQNPFSISAKILTNFDFVVQNILAQISTAAAEQNASYLYFKEVIGKKDSAVFCFTFFFPLILLLRCQFSVGYAFSVCCLKLPLWKLIIRLAITTAIYCFRFVFASFKMSVSFLLE